MVKPPIDIDAIGKAAAYKVWAKLLRRCEGAANREELTHSNTTTGSLTWGFNPKKAGVNLSPKRNVSRRAHKSKARRITSNIASCRSLPPIVTPQSYAGNADRLICGPSREAVANGYGSCRGNGLIRSQVRQVRPLRGPPPPLVLATFIYYGMASRRSEM